MIERFAPTAHHSVSEPLLGGLMVLIVVGLVTLAWVAIKRGGDQ